MEHYCEKCGRLMDIGNFYRSNNLEKYPVDGLLNQCKKCFTMHVDNFDPNSYKPLLQELDLPYVKDEWDKILVKYKDKPDKLTGTTILGRYISKMKLKQWRDYTWKDTERLEEELRLKKVEALERTGLSAEQAAEKLAGKTSQDEQIEEIALSVTEEPEESDFSPIEEEEDTEITSQLTEEDKIYLRLKWGKGYRADEWVKLEQLYEDMMASYDIQSAGHKDTLKMICKASLKANQLIDIGDVDGFQKLSKVYDSLMKSGAFTAAQNKTESGDGIDSVGELVAMCEKEGFIPKYYVNEPQDKVDRTLEDIKNYTRSLVLEEVNLGSLIEEAVKSINKDKQNEDMIVTEEGQDDKSFEESLFSENAIEALTDGDYQEFYNLEEELGTEDELMLSEEEEVEDT